MSKKTCCYYHHNTCKVSQLGPIESNVKNIKINYNESLAGKFIEILNATYLNSNFHDALKLFKLLCNFEKNLNRIKLNSVLNGSGNSSSNSPIVFQTMVNPQLIKNLITNWIMFSNFLCSSNQFKKSKFIKNLVITLLDNDLYDPNDCSVQYYLNNTPTSNNLLNHCIKLIYLSKTCYQLELIYDFMRMLIQRGANPNLDPSAKLDSDLILDLECSQRFNKTTSNCILAQFCQPNDTIGTCLNMPRNIAHLNNPIYHHQHSHIHINSHTHNHNHLTHPYNVHHSHHHNHHHPFQQNHSQHAFQVNTQHLPFSSSIPHLTSLEISNKTLSKSEMSMEKIDHIGQECNSIGMEKFIASCQIACKNSKKHLCDEHETLNVSTFELNSSTTTTTSNTTTPKTNNTIGSHSVLLLTPTPSYASMLSISSASSSPLFISPDRSSNVIIDSSMLFLSYYKKIVKLLFDSMNDDVLRDCVKSLNTSNQHNHYRSHNSHNQNYNRCYPSTPSSSKPATPYQQNSHQIKCSVCSSHAHLNACATESLDMYLERLASNPRSLKSLARRKILNRLIDTEQNRSSSTTNKFLNNSKNHHQCSTKSSNKSSSLIATPYLVNKLSLPKRVKNYLLYIE